jgi:small-conductance mechanosensitive channel
MISLQVIPGIPPELTALLENSWLYALAVLFIGVAFGYLVGKLNERLLRAAGVPAAVEGTSFERTAQSLGTSTVGIVARLSSWFIYAVSAIVAITIAELISTQIIWTRVTGFVPQLFIATLVVVVGFVVADKAELLVGERLRGVKLPEVNLLPRVVKYSVLYVAFLIALGQIGVHTLALIALLTVYAFAIVFVGALAMKDFLSSGAAGVYILLNQPYGIGDEVKIGDREGIVQGVDVVVTRIESEEEEHIVPNRLVLEHGIVRKRQ